MASYGCVGDIPDLRLSIPSWLDYEKDRIDALRLMEGAAGLSIEQIVRRVYGGRPGWDRARVELRTRQVMQGPKRLHADVNGWLRRIVGEKEPFLDLGCGGGTLLAATAIEGRQGIGIDVSMVWLVVARRMISQYGGRPVLAAATADALPLADASVSGTISLDVIEHVSDPPQYLREINRVVKPGGHVALTTPNRYSLAAEPHVFVWGVGWLPRRWQQRYVNWRSGKSYESTCLLSRREAAHLIRRNTKFDCQIIVPEVPAQEIAHFPSRRARLARLYNRLLPIKPFRWLFLIVGPFFRIEGIRS